MQVVATVTAALLCERVRSNR